MADNTIQELARLEVKPVVFAKYLFWEDWVEVPYCYWSMLGLRLSPEITRGEIFYRFGEHELRHDQQITQLYQPRFMNGLWVKLVARHDDAGSGSGSTALPDDEELAIGLVYREDLEFHSNVENQGLQKFSFKGLVSILADKKIEGSYVFEGEEPWDPTLVRYVRSQIQFNERYNSSYVKPGDNGLRGNRIDDELAFAMYSHINPDAPPKKWSIYNILSYFISKNNPELLPMNTNDNVQWALAMTPALQTALEETYGVFETKNKTVKQLFDEMLPREMGLAWELKVEDPEDPEDPDKDHYTIEIHVYSLYEEETTIGDTTFPPNANQVPYVIPEDVPQSHFFRIPHYVQDQTTTYGELEVRGNPVWVMFNADKDRITKDWGDDLEADFKDAGGATGPAEADLFREQDIYDGVYEDFQIIKNWDFTDYDGHYIIPEFYQEDDEGTIRLRWRWKDKPAEDAWDECLFDKKITRELPIVKGVDYGANETGEPIDKHPEDTAKEFRLPWFAVWDDSIGGGGWHLADKLRDANPSWSSMAVTLMDDKLGWKFRAPLAYLGLNHYDGSVSNWEGAFDWVDQFALIAMRLSIRPSIVFQLKYPDPDHDDPDTDPPLIPYPVGTVVENKRLVIDVDDAELWIAPPQCRVDVSGFTSKIIANEEIRNDLDRIEQVAAFVKLWYEKNRFNAKITVRGLSASPTVAPELGSLITNMVVAGTGKTIKLGTICSNLDLNSKEQTTTIGTDFPNLIGGTAYLLNLI